MSKSTGQESCPRVEIETDVRLWSINKTLRELKIGAGVERTRYDKAVEFTYILGQLLKHLLEHEKQYLLVVFDAEDIKDIIHEKLQYKSFNKLWKIVPDLLVLLFLFSTVVFTA